MTHADAIDAIRRRRARRHARRHVPPPRPPTAVERRFRAELLRAVRRLGALIREKTAPVLARLDSGATYASGSRADAFESASFEEALNAASSAWLNEFPFAKLLEFSYNAAEDASLHQRRQFVSQVKAVLGVNVDMVEAWAPQKLVDASQTSADLIVTLARDGVEDVRAHALNAIATGARHETVAKLLEKRLGVTESHAKLLARDQISKIVSDFEQERQVRAGITRYEWRTLNDGRVRERHEELRGKIFSWDDPPIINEKTGERGHPGDDYQCRCYASPIFEEEDDDGVLMLGPGDPGSGGVNRPAFPLARR